MKTITLEIPVKNERDVTLQELLAGVLSSWYQEDILIGEVRAMVIADGLDRLEEMKITYKMSNKGRTRDYSYLLKKDLV
jgi:hypothetical protein